jgi:hypothetical protein
MLMTRNRLSLLLGALLVSGCASMSAVQVGQTAGAIAGAAALPGVGTPLGSVLGMLVGLVVQQHVDQVTETRERRDLAQQLDPRAMPLPAYVPLTGEPMRVWVDERVEHGKVLAGHFEALQ